jgi:hypothetical protein
MDSATGDDSMKKHLIAVMAALLVLSAAGAQTADRRAIQTPGPTVKVSGKLELIDGSFALKSGGKTYLVLVPMLNQLGDRVPRLKEGASVTLEGSVRQRPDSAAGTVTLRVITLILNGKRYDLSAMAAYSRGDSAKRSD